jgi:acetyl-CoA acetyltransferase
MTIARKAAITGLGVSDVGRRLRRDPLELTAQAALAAIADAGLSVREIDGVSTYPGAFHHTPGFTGAGAVDVCNLLGLEPRWHCGGAEVPGQLGSISTAVLAVASGVADHVLCFRSVWESSAQLDAGRAAAVTGNIGLQSFREWGVPFGATPVTSGALTAQRYFHDYNATREQLAQIALNARRNAAGNPFAVYKDPLTLDDYMNARIVSSPLCLYDCDPPVDGCIALVVSHRSAVGSSHRTPVVIEAAGTAMGYRAAADVMWSQTTISPADVDVAEVYDGFSIYSLLWLEALGLCGRGEAASFVEGGARIALDGELPLATGGGQLSAGRLHGYLHVFEACTQLRGDGGDRQVHPRPEVAVASNGAGRFTGCLLLSR